jgi:hypothetical protein
MENTTLRNQIDLLPAHLQQEGGAFYRVFAVSGAIKDK